MSGAFFEHLHVLTVRHTQLHDACLPYIVASPVDVRAHTECIAFT